MKTTYPSLSEFSDRNKEKEKERERERKNSVVLLGQPGSFQGNVSASLTMDLTLSFR
jgi:hypothetical protein